MKNTFISLALCAVLGLNSCGSDNLQKTKDNPSKTTVAKKVSYDPEATKIIWTAFKTTDKIGVTGQFPSFKVTGTVPAENIIDVFRNASITIDTKSVSTGNELRNNRIVESYFGIFVNTTEIKCKIVALNQSSGKIAVTLNEITNNIPVKVTIKGNSIKLQGTLDVNLFDGQAATDSLNKVCEDVHKGADGVTKLWPDVEIMVKSTVK